MNNNEFDELKAAARPLQDYLNENYDPHTIIIVRDDRIDVYRGEMGCPTPETIKD